MKVTAAKPSDSDTTKQYRHAHTKTYAKIFFAYPHSVFAHLNQLFTLHCGAMDSKKKTKLKIQFCYLCEEFTKESAKIHQVQHVSSKGAFDCTVCQFHSDSFSKLQNHISKAHPEKRKHRCFQCEAVFKSPKSLILHAKYVHQRQDILSLEFKCELCGKQFSNATRRGKSGLRKHMMLVHGEKKKMFCSICQIDLANEGSFKVHNALVHSGTKRYQCEHCEKAYYFRCDLLEHSNNCHPNNETQVFECDKCDHKTRYKSNLQKHKDLMHNTDREQFECNVCNKIFYTKANLKQHEKALHKINVEKLKCNICTFETVYTSALKVHMKSIHLNLRPHQCDKCDRTFRSKYFLQSHLTLVHANKKERNFQCNVCSKSFSLKGNMIAHVKRIHENEKNKECTHCLAKFKSNTELEHHLFTHTSKRPLHCEYCDKGFILKKSLSAHLKTCFSKK